VTPDTTSATGPHLPHADQHEVESEDVARLNGGQKRNEPSERPRGDIRLDAAPGAGQDSPSASPSSATSVYRSDCDSTPRSGVPSLLASIVPIAFRLP
jgi:hypothetical protein